MGLWDLGPGVPANQWLQMPGVPKEQWVFSCRWAAFQPVGGSAWDYQREAHICPHPTHLCYALAMVGEIGSREERYACAIPSLTQLGPPSFP